MCTLRSRRKSPKRFTPGTLNQSIIDLGVEEHMVEAIIESSDEHLMQTNV